MMLVTVRIDRQDQELLKLEGIAEFYPAIGQEFVIVCGQIYVNLGEVINIKPFKGMLLVQTEDVVAEIWVQTNSGELIENVLPFVRPLKMSEQSLTHSCRMTLVNLS